MFERVSARARRVVYGPPPPPPPPPAPVRYVWLEEAPPPPPPAKKKRRVPFPNTLTGFILVVVIVLIAAAILNAVAKQTFAFSPPYSATVTSRVSLNAQSQALVSSDLEIQFTRSVQTLDLPLKGAEPYNIALGQGQISPAEQTPGLTASQLWYYHYSSPVLRVGRSDTANPGGAVTIVANPSGDPDLRITFARGVSGHLSLFVSFTVDGAVRQGPSGPELDVWPYLDPGAEHGATRGIVLPDGVSSADVQLAIPALSDISCQLGTFSGAWTNVFSLVGMPCAQTTGAATPTPMVAPSTGSAFSGTRGGTSPSPTPAVSFGSDRRVAAVRVVAALPYGTLVPSPVPTPAAA